MNDLQKKETRAWVAGNIKDKCDADPNHLADYVLALLKNHLHSRDFRKTCVSRLKEFLGDATDRFVRDLCSFLLDVGVILHDEQSQQELARRAAAKAAATPAAAPAFAAVASSAPSAPTVAAAAPVVQSSARGLPAVPHLAVPEPPSAAPKPRLPPPSESIYTVRQELRPAAVPSPGTTTSEEKQGAEQLADEERRPRTEIPRMEAATGHKRQRESGSEGEPPQLHHGDGSSAGRSRHGQEQHRRQQQHRPQQQQQQQHHHHHHQQQAWRDRDSKTVSVENIPDSLLNPAVISDYFKQFGQITNVHVEPEASRALVSFSSPEEAKAAWSSRGAILNDRFIKLYWHRASQGDRKQAASQHPHPHRHRDLDHHTAAESPEAGIPVSSGEASEEQQAAAAAAFVEYQKQMMAAMALAASQPTVAGYFVPPTMPFYGYGGKSRNVFQARPRLDDKAEEIQAMETKITDLKKQAEEKRNLCQLLRKRLEEQQELMKTLSTAPAEQEKLLVVKGELVEMTDGFRREMSEMSSVVTLLQESRKQLEVLGQQQQQYLRSQQEQQQLQQPQQQASTEAAGESPTQIAIGGDSTVSTSSGASRGAASGQPLLPRAARAAGGWSTKLDLRPRSILVKDLSMEAEGDPESKLKELFASAGVAAGDMRLDKENRSAIVEFSSREAAEAAVAAVAQASISYEWYRKPQPAAVSETAGAAVAPTEIEPSNAST